MPQKKDSNVILVHSYKGGTGKTALSINLAQYFGKAGKQVLLVELDTGGPSFQNIFRISPKKTWNDFYAANLPFKELIVKRKDYDVICAREGGLELRPGENLHQFYQRQLERLRRQKAWLRTQGYDYVILDTHPGYTVELVNLILVADIALLVTRLDTDTITKTIDMYEQVYSHFTKKKIILVQNQVPTPVAEQTDPELDADVEKALHKWNQFLAEKTLVTIPYQNEIAYALFRSKIAQPTNPFMKYIGELTRLIEKDG